MMKRILRSASEGRAKQAMTTATHLECSLCGKTHETAKIWNLCACGGPLLVRYDLDLVRRSWNRDWIKNAPPTMWRYAPVLPVSKPASIVSLGEGMTPLIRAGRLAKRLGASEIWIKDEALNPAGSSEARGSSSAVSMAVELGITKVAMAPAGSAAGALAAYAAAAGIEAHIFVPRDAPQSDSIESKAFGASLTLADGLTGDCAQMLAARRDQEGWFDMSALCEPYRLEGSKTIGYELAEQMNWELPDAILWPTGEGLGLLGMWKAFEEMEALGWISPKRPKMVAVQAEGCQPVVRAFASGAGRCEFFANAATLASGLRVPKPLGDFLILKALRASGGTAVAVSDAAMLDAGLELASSEGVFPAPEGGAAVAALKKLLANGFLKRGERIVVSNTASGLKYLEAYSRRLPGNAGSEQDKLGGLITPR